MDIKSDKDISDKTVAKTTDASVKDAGKSVKPADKKIKSRLKAKSMMKIADKFSPVVYIFFIAILAVVFYLVYMLIGWNSYMSTQAGNLSLKETQQQASLLSYQLEQLMKKTEELSDSFAVANSENELVAAMDLIKGKIEFSYLRYFNNGVEFTQAGTKVLTEAPEVEALVATGIRGLTIQFTDSENKKDCIAFYVPTDEKFESDFIDGLVGFYEVSNLDEISNYKDTNAEASAYGLSVMDGKMLFGYLGQGVTTTNKSLYEFLNLHKNQEGSILTDVQIEKLKEDIEAGEDGFFAYSVGSTAYVFSYSTIDPNGTRLVFTKLYEVNKIADPIVKAPVRLIGIMIAAGLLFVLVILYYVFINNRFSDYANRFADTDPLLGCRNYYKFQHDAEKVYNDNKNTQFAVIYIDIRRFGYIQENYSLETSNKTLLFISDMFTKFLGKNEPYGHISDGHFVALMHFKDIDELLDRYKVMYTVVYNFAMGKEYNYHVKLTAGIYCIEREKNLKMQEMIDRAITAQRINNINAVDIYSIYDETVRKEFVKESMIESKMEQALDNEDFKVYLQPKLNLNSNKIDGAEALVRWDDPEMGQIMPGDFIPLFENNGFVSRLDRYMYVMVCKYISDYVKRGERVVPISVNVSRVTAMQNDFIEFYVGTKNKYNIADGFLMLEFTESFAFENYDILKTIITELRRNGINCSIDDFGSGYSSFSILKELPMNELKLDRLFLKQGISKERDDIMLTMVIKLAQAFHMKVTQEGVETRQELERLRELGCEVIQGYIYSKPMTKEDFGKFLYNAMLHYN